MIENPVMLDILIVLAFILALCFPLNYLRSRWRSTLPGKALMTFSLIIALVTGLGTWVVFTGDFAPDWLRIISYSSIVFGLLMMNAVLLREQNRDWHKEYDVQTVEESAR